MKRKTALSSGEELLAQHLVCYKIEYLREVALVPGRRWRWDFVVGDLAIEVQGQVWHKGGHTSGYGVTRDAQKLNAAVLAGYRPLIFTTQMVQSGEAIDTICSALRC